MFLYVRDKLILGCAVVDQVGRDVISLICMFVCVLQFCVFANNLTSYIKLYLFQIGQRGFSGVSELSRGRIENNGQK